MKHKTDDELISILKEYYRKHGRPPEMGEFNNINNLVDFRTYYRRFGSWNNALKKAGIPIRKKIEFPKKITVEVEIEDYVKLKTHLIKEHKSISRWMREMIEKIKL
jgi:hypothetical protein